MASVKSTEFSRLAPWLSALRASIVLVLLCGGVYPLLITLVGGVLFSYESTGSLVLREGEVVGSALVGQKFTSDEYFHGRPSSPDYDPFSVGGSNLAASNPELRSRVQSDAVAISTREDVPKTSIPVDLLAASGSGIDPHISPESAGLQVPRIARARGLSEDDVDQLVAEYTEGRSFGVFGQPRVNVLQINLALDNLEANK